MKVSPVTKDAISALKKADIASHDVALIMQAALKKIERFEPDDMALCTGLLLDKLRAIPLQDTIHIDPDTGRMYIRNKLVKDVSVQKRIIEQAKQLQRNIVRKLVKEKVEFEATDIGIRKATNLWDIVFAKSALWFSQQEDKIYQGITGHKTEWDESEE